MPETLLRKASLASDGHAWRQGDVEQVVNAAREAGLACDGWEVQFHTRDGIYEAYWLSASQGPEDRRAGESWPDYVTRAAAETLQSFRILCRNTDFRLVARISEELRTIMDREGSDPIDDLRFEMGFAAQPIS